MKKILVRFYSSRSGGEYSYGMVIDKDVIEFLKNKIENGENISQCIDFQDWDDLCAYNYSDIVQIYGPDVDEDSTITIELCDQNCEWVEDIQDIPIAIDETKITTFTASVPYFVPDDDMLDDFLLWGNQRIEKRVQAPICIELAENEELDLSNLFIGSMCLEETIGDVNIFEVAYYIRKEQQKQLMNEYNQKHNSDYDTFEDFIYDVYRDDKDIFSSFECDIGDIEGKGEYENDFNFIQDSEEKLLYQEGEY